MSGRGFVTYLYFFQVIEVLYVIPWAVQMVKCLTVLEC